MPEHMPAPTFSRAVYGFVLYLALKTLFVLYLLWAFVPDWIFEKYLNISYIPQKHWAIAVPILCLNLITIFAFLIYPALNLCMTPNMDDLRTITDSCARSTMNKNKVDSLELLLKKTNVLERFYNGVAVSGGDSIKLGGGGGANGFSKHNERWERQCTCKYSNKCYKFTGGERTQKRGYNSYLSEANYSVPPCADINISNVCKNLYL